MAEQLFDHFADIRALEAEKTQVLSIFADIAKGVGDLSKLGFKIDSAKGMSDLTAATKQLAEMQDKLAASQRKIEEGEARLRLMEAALNKERQEGSEAVKQQGDHYRSLTGELSQNIQKQIDLRKRLQDVKQEIKSLNSEGNTVGFSSSLTKQIAALTEEEQKLKLEIENTNRFVKNQSREFLAADGSLEQMRARLNQMLQAYDSFSDAQKASPQGQANLQVIQDLTDEINKQEQATKRYFRNVGNYQGSAKIIADAFERAQQRMSTMNTEARQSWSSSAAGAQRGTKHCSA
jgi:chromosome segregation ATPase